MIHACILAKDKLCKQDWNAKNITEFLNNYSIKQFLLNKILDKSKPPIDNMSNESLEDIIIQAYLSLVWEDLYKTYHWIDAPIYLHFIGVVKNTNFVIDKWTIFLGNKLAIAKQLL